MTAREGAAPGQAARAVPGIYANWYRTDRPGARDAEVATSWRLCTPAEQVFWCGMQVQSDLAAAAKAAPEMAAAMAESRQLRDYLDDFTHAVIDSRQSVKLAEAARSVRRKAGLPALEEP